MRDDAGYRYCPWHEGEITVSLVCRNCERWCPYREDPEYRGPSARARGERRPSYGERLTQGFDFMLASERGEFGLDPGE